MHKFVSEKATFVAYLPEGWKAQEGTQPTFRTIVISDTTGRYEAALFYGANPAPDLISLARLFIGGIGRRFPDLKLLGATKDRSGGRLIADATYTNPRSGPRELRCWLSLHGAEFTYQSIEAPAGELVQMKARLLTILSNVRIMKGASGSGVVAPPAVTFAPMAPRQLRDGSATLRLPQDWVLQELGAGSFVATDPTSLYTAMVASVQVVTPQPGARPLPGIPMAPFMPPHRALEFLAGQAGLMRDMRVEHIVERQDILQLAAPYSRGGPLAAEEFVYTFTGRSGPSKGFTFGITSGSPLGIEWRLWHMTAAAPADRFDQAVPTLAEVLGSFQINDEYARRYVEAGMARLRQMQRQTAQMVADNARDIHAMMQAAYDERQRSMDYIDYQRTNYIRGEQDWISSIEGGTVYHTDTWGTKNTTTGEFWGDQPYDYVNFTGQNPKHPSEQMTPVDTRQLWEQAIRR